MDEFERAEHLTELVGEAHQLAVKLGIDELSGRHTLDDVRRLEKVHRVKAMALKRLLRRVDSQESVEYEMTKTDAERCWETERKALTEKFMREKNMTRIMASASACYVVEKLKRQEEEKEVVN